MSISLATTDAHELFCSTQDFPPIPFMNFLSESIYNTQTLRTNTIQFNLAVHAVSLSIKLLRHQYSGIRSSFFIEEYIAKYLLPLHTNIDDEELFQPLCDAYDELYQCYVCELKVKGNVISTLANMRRFVPVYCIGEIAVIRRMAKLMIKTSYLNMDDFVACHGEITQFLSAFNGCTEPRMFRMIAALVAKVAYMVVNYGFEDEVDFKQLEARYLTPVPKV